MTRQDPAPENRKPSAAVLREALSLERRKLETRASLLTALSALSVFIAAACALSVFFLPIVRVRGAAMSPALYEGDVLLAPALTDPENGSLVAFYAGNKLLVRRVIAGPGDWVQIDPDGSVFVNNIRIDEPYVKNPGASGDTAYPLQIPDEKYFVLGDDRNASVDSRHSELGLVSKSDILGLPVLRIWPVDRFGTLS